LEKSNLVADNLFMLFRLIRIWVASAWQAPVGVDDTLLVHRRVGLFDLDLNLHMNHARYLVVVEETLIEGLQRSGFLRSILGIGSVPMVGGTMISYRRELKVFQPYQVKLNYLGADDCWHIFSFTFENQKGQAIALGFVKGGAVGRRGAARGLLSSQALWDAHRARHPALRAQPGIAADASKWLKAEKESFEKWRYEASSV
jgi:acyl-CoA thioesterase FadM